MAHKDAHVQMAKQNLLAIVDLSQCENDHSAWIASIAFYRALHLVEAVFASEATVRHCHSHEVRNGILKREKKFQHIWKHYRPLFAASLVARYLDGSKAGKKGLSSFSQYLSSADVEHELLNHRLHQIEKSVASLLHIKIEDLV